MSANMATSTRGNASGAESSGAPTTNTARREILQRIRAALRDVNPEETPQQVLVDRTYRQTSDTPSATLIEQFAERVAEYKATVHRVPAADLAATIAAACQRRGVHQLVIPTDLPATWQPPGIELLPDQALSYAQLDSSGGVLTGCALGIAQTGTIVLDGGAYQGRRAISLLPDYHLCVVEARQIVGLVPEAVTALAPAVREERRPVTLISGPSATSDIELNRVEGVHGPRTLEVFIVE